MINKKKVPIRTCLGCGEPKEKKSLIRVVRSPEGELSVDITGKKSGRGAYICPNPECLKKAKKAKRLEKAFECQIPDEVWQKLESQMEEATGNG